MADRRLLARGASDELLLFKVNVTPPPVAGIVKLQSEISPEPKKPVLPSVVMKPVTPSTFPGVLLTLYVVARADVTLDRPTHTTSQNNFIFIAKLSA